MIAICHAVIHREEIEQNAGELKVSSSCGQKIINYNNLEEAQVVATELISKLENGCRFTIRANKQKLSIYL